jgi:hypothetical protein
MVHDEAIKTITGEDKYPRIKFITSWYFGGTTNRGEVVSEAETSVELFAGGCY